MTSTEAVRANTKRFEAARGKHQASAAGRFHIA